MKNHKLVSRNLIAAMAATAATVATLLSATPSQAFSLKLQENLDVADANFCGDYNHMATYALSLSRAEALPENELSLLSAQNLNLIEEELKAHFTVPRSAQTLRIVALGAEAGQLFSGETLKHLELQEYCFGKDLRTLFGFEMVKNKFTPKTPGDVTYMRLAFDLPPGSLASEPATVIINRKTQTLYIHQEW